MKLTHYALLAALAFSAPLQAASYRERMQEVNNLIGAKEHEKAIAALNGIVEDKSIANDDRLSAYGRLIEIYRNQKRLDDAIAAGVRTLEVPTDDSRRKQLMFSLAELNSQGNKIPAAVQVIRNLIARYPDDEETVVQASLNAANYLARDKQHAASVEFYDQAAARMDPDELRIVDVLWGSSTGLWNSEQTEKSIEVARKLLDPRYRQSGRLTNREPQERIISGLVKLKKPAEAIAQLKEWETTDPDLDQRPRWCLRGVWTARSANDHAAAREILRRLLTVHAGQPISDGWYEAQWAVVDDQLAKSDLPGALKGLHILIDAAPDQGALVNAIGRTSDVLQKLDGNRKRARALIGYQLFGPAGKDGQPGNADDEKNPMDEVGYPEDADRKAAFAKAYSEVGDDAAAAFHRGQLCLYIGAPKAALLHYQDALKRASANQWPGFAVGALNALRASRGHAHGMETAAKYLLEGTGDDPFKDVASGTSPFAKPNVAPDAAKALATLRQSLLRLLDDPTLPISARQQTIRAWSRTSEAAGVYDQTDRFLLIAADTDSGIRDAAASYLLAASREGQIHAGGIRTLLSSNRLPAAAQKRADAEFRQSIKAMEKLLTKAAWVPKLQLPKE